MATARDIVRGALLELRVINSHSNPEAQDMSDGLAKLNGLMHALANEGTSYTHTTMTASTTFPWDPELEEPAKMWLAKNLAGQFGKALTLDQDMQASRGLESIMATYRDDTDMSYDIAISRLSTTRTWS